MKILKEEGVKGFFRGYSATLLTTPLFHSIYFPVYEKLRIRLAEQFDGKKTDFKIVSMSSVMTGILCNVITNPLWLVRVRMQAEIFRDTSHHNYNKKYKSVFGSINRIYKREGFLALYTGLAASMMGITHVAIYFPLYEQFKLYFKGKYNQTDANLSPQFIF
jgi:solute carrier family 25 folate transporter 32